MDTNSDEKRDRMILPRNIEYNCLFCFQEHYINLSIKFYYQMENNEGPKLQVSPSKSRIIMELQQTTERQVNLRKINDELTKIIQNSYEENSNLTLINKLNSVQTQHNKEIQSLKLKQHLLQADHNCELQQYKNKLQQAIYKVQSAESQIQSLKQYIFKNKKEKEEMEGKIKKYQKMINNQQNLIDEYRQSIDEQILLEKEVIKAIYAEKQLENKRKFEEALKCMEDNYERKLKQMQMKQIKKEYHDDLKTLKNMCKSKIHNKENINVETRKLKGPSSYSTLQK